MLPRPARVKHHPLIRAEEPAGTPRQVDTGGRGRKALGVGHQFRERHPGRRRTCAQTPRDIKSVWIKEQHVDVTDGRVTGHRVHVLVTFILDE
ncbi:dodecin domain-containing protein [Lentzea sp. NPDC102401]|uniref:dodecin domain-containing protein n=1 Tax=Lentzea sp. NPDC102401 TaxID=3364128 RepID=UPI0037F36340